MRPDTQIAVDQARVAASADIASCFNIFLGRAPDELSARRIGAQPLTELIKDLLTAAEFKDSVLAAALLRDPLPHLQIAPAPPIKLVDWAQSRLPLARTTRRWLGHVRSWTQMLEILLSDTQLLTLAPELETAGIQEVLLARLEREPFTKLTRSVIGTVDAASAFEVRGWALDLCDKSVPVTVEFYADTLFLGAIACDEPRPDVGEAVGGGGKCGFTFRIASRHRTSFAQGRSLIAVEAMTRAPIGKAATVYADAAQNWDLLEATRRELVQLRHAVERIESRLPDLSRMASMPLEAYEEYWERFYRPAADVLTLQRDRVKALSYQPLISVVVPTWNADTRLLALAIESVMAQTYEHWELIIADDATAQRAELEALLRRFAADARIVWHFADSRAGIAGNTNRALARATGEYVALLDHDDELAPDALFQVVSALQEKPYGLLYSDEDRIEGDAQGRCTHHTPYFKPDFDPDLLLSLNYICHLAVLRRDLLSELGGFRAGFEGAQDHDLLLRATARLGPESIRHIPRVLYHWRVTTGSVSRTPALHDSIQASIVAAVSEHLQLKNAAARVESHSDSGGTARPFATQVRWQLPVAAPDVSIIIPTRDRVDLLRPCIESILGCAQTYPGRLELLIVDNDSAEDSTREYFASLGADTRVRVMPYGGQFNWSGINNTAAHATRADVLIFLNNDTVVLGPTWCSELVANAVRPDVGAVGARLLYGDGTIQHAGVILGVEGAAGHECIGETLAAGGYFGRTHLQRSTAAVTGACLATRRELFERLGGFDDLELKVAFSDIDYCLKVRRAGFRVVYNPLATLYHFESKSRGHELTNTQQKRHRSESECLQRRWGRDLQADPYYNAHFERFGRPWERLRPPPGWV